MATIEERQAERDALIKRISSLTSRVTSGDQTVQYDLQAARHALEILDGEIARLSDKKRYSFAAFRKG